MKTVKQIADEYEVSVQAIYKHLNSPLNLALNPKESLKVKRGNITYITPAGEEYFKLNLFKHTFKPLNQKTVGSNKNRLKVNAYQVDVLQEQMAFIKDQLSDLREENKKLIDLVAKQSESLSAQSAQIAELARNNQILLGAEQSRTNPVLINGGGPTAPTAPTGPTGPIAPTAPAPIQEEKPPKKRGGFFGIFRR